MTRLHQSQLVRVGDRDVELRRRRALVIGARFVATAELDGVRYEVVPRGLRLGELLRDRATVAVLARPWRAELIIRWSEDAELTDDETALARALATYAGF